MVDALIARTWHGWAPPATADDYQLHYESEVIAHLQSVPGFVAAHLLRKTDGEEVIFTSVIFFERIEDVEGFAGADYDLAVLKEAGRAALSRWDARVTHHEAVINVHR